MKRSYLNPPVASLLPPYRGILTRWQIYSAGQEKLPVCQNPPVGGKERSDRGVNKTRARGDTMDKNTPQKQSWAEKSFLERLGIVLGILASIVAIAGGIYFLWDRYKPSVPVDTADVTTNEETTIKTTTTKPTTSTTTATTTTTTTKTKQTLELLVPIPDWGGMGKLSIAFVDPVLNAAGGIDYGVPEKVEVIKEANVILNGEDYKTYIQGTGKHAIKISIDHDHNDRDYIYTASVDFTTDPPTLRSVFHKTFTIEPAQ